MVIRYNKIGIFRLSVIKGVKTSMIKITFFKNIFTRTGNTVECSFEELAAMIKQSVKIDGTDRDKVYNKCFIRTQCRGARKDGNCDDSSVVIIIDADRAGGASALVEPSVAHNVLKDMGINHLIYTSWSHKSDPEKQVNKYRILIPVEGCYNKRDIVSANWQILRILKENGVDIKHVKEMDSWSQPWFYGRHIGEYECYEYYGGKEFQVDPDERSCEDKEDEEVSQEDEDGGKEKDEGKVCGVTKQELYDNIRTGAEFHESLRTLSYQMIKDGMSNADVKAYLKVLMDGSLEAGSDRWQKRYGEIDRLVDGAEKLSGEDSAGWCLAEEKKFKKISLPKAPGLMGQFMTELEEFMNYRDETIAFVSSIFIVSSIIGRKFNVDINDADGRGKPTALNMYLTLAAETGSGKSEIEDAVENCYIQFSGANGNIQDFFYKGRVSGPRALYKRYLNQRVIGFIQNEKGIAGQSSLGDQQGMKDAWLNLYGQGAWNKWSGAAGFTDSDTDVKSLRGVAVSYVGESTPVELRKAYSKGDQVANGTIPREMIFTISELNTKPNRNIRKCYSKSVVDRFIELVNLCHPESASDVYAPVIITSAGEADREKYLDVQEAYRVRQNEGEDVLERAMSSRAFVKMLRLAGICTVINKGPYGDRINYIDRDEWEWARSVVEYEYANMEQIVNLTNGTDDLGAAVKFAVTKIKQMLDDKISDSTLRLDKESRVLKLIPCTNLKKAIRYNSAVLALNGDPKKAYRIVSGVDKVINYMIDLGIISKPEKNKLRRGECYRVLKAINEYI